MFPLFDFICLIVPLAAGMERYITRKLELEKKGRQHAQQREKGHILEEKKKPSRESLHVIKYITVPME